VPPECLRYKIAFALNLFEQHTARKAADDDCDGNSAVRRDLAAELHCESAIGRTRRPSGDELGAALQQMGVTDRERRYGCAGNGGT
jgi:hypothetical protein